jgi:hypothetical protein
MATPCLMIENARRRRARLGLMVGPVEQVDSSCGEAIQQVAAILQPRIAPRTVAVELLFPFHQVSLAAVFLDQPKDVIAALSGALGAFDAKHVEIGSGHWNSQFSRGLLSAFTRLPKYRPNYATPIYELGHVGYSGFDSHTTTLAPPSKRGFFSRFMLSTPTGIRTRPEPVESV